MSASMAGGGSQRFQEIDVFRGIAALWVVYYHFIFRYRIECARPGEPLGWFSIPGLPEKYLGLLPVFWFFMISGFVIVWTLERCDTWQDFAVARFSRLYPTYWIALAFTFVVGTAAPLENQQYSLGLLVANFSMVQEIFGIPHVDGVYWSLTIELLFYVYAVCVFAGGLMPRLQAICLVWVSLCVLNHAMPHFGVDMWWKVQKYGLLLHGHFLAAGVMFYQLWARRGLAIPCLILSLCLVSILLAYPLPVAALCAMFFVSFALAVTGRLRWLSSRPLVWLGGISYPLYVSHQMFGYRLMVTAEDAGVPRELAALLAAIAALGLAALISGTVERPALKAIRSAWRRRKAATAEVA